MSINGAAPGEKAPAGETRPAGCPPCPARRANVTRPLPTPTGPGSVSDAEVAAAAAHQAGFRGEALVTAVAIARVESTWDPEATNGSHFGLWQIAREHKGKVPGWDTEADIFDPLLNARYAFALYSARPGTGEAKFADWIPFEKTDYRRYLDAPAGRSPPPREAPLTSPTPAAPPRRSRSPESSRLRSWPASTP